MSAGAGTVDRVTAVDPVVLRRPVPAPPVPPLAVFASLGASGAPPGVLTVDVLDPAAMSSPGALWRPNHELVFRWHPAVAAALEELGGSRSGLVFSFVRSRFDAAAFFAAVDPAYLDARGEGRSRAERVAGWCGQVGVAVPAGLGGQRRVRSLSVAVSCSARRVRVELVAAPHMFASVAVSTSPVRVDHLDAAAALAAAVRARVVCADCSATPRFSAAAALAASSVAFTEVVDAPGLAFGVAGSDAAAAPEYCHAADLDAGAGPGVSPLVGELAPFAEGSVMVAAAAEESAASLDGRVPLFISARLADEAFAVDPVHLEVPGLSPTQAELVSRYVASRAGVVCALRPGAGKTVCTAAAFSAAFSAAGRPSRWRALVLAPATTLPQWAGELARWFPSARVLVATAAGELLSGLRRGGVDPVVLVCTPALAARCVDGLCSAPVGDRGWRFDELCIDEAAWLASSSSKRTAAAQQLRAVSGRAVALSGTPASRGADDLGALIAWASGRTELFSKVPLSRWVDPAAAPVPGFTHAEVCGSLLFTSDAPIVTPAGAAPVVHPVRVPLVPSAREQTVSEELWGLLAAAVSASQAAAGEVAAVRAAGGATLVPRRRAAAARTAVSSLLRLVRVAHSAPSAVLGASAVPGAAELVAHLGAVDAVKLQWLAEFAAGRRSDPLLVFCDSAAAAPAAVAALCDGGVHAEVLTSTPTVRAGLLERFAAGRIPVLVVPPASQLGVNLAAASAVVHLDVSAPGTVDVLVQRCARAARVGASAAVVESFSPVVSGTVDEVLWELLWDPFVAAAADPGRLGVEGSVPVGAGELLAARPAPCT